MRAILQADTSMNLPPPLPRPQRPGFEPLVKMRERLLRRRQKLYSRQRLFGSLGVAKSLLAVLKAAGATDSLIATVVAR